LKRAKVFFLPRGEEETLPPSKTGSESSFFFEGRKRVFFLLRGERERERESLLSPLKKAKVFFLLRGDRKRVFFLLRREKETLPPSSFRKRVFFFLRRVFFFLREEEASRWCREAMISRGAMSDDRSLIQI